MPPNLCLSMSLLSMALLNYRRVAFLYPTVDGERAWAPLLCSHQDSSVDSLVDRLASCFLFRRPMDHNIVPVARR